jgi:hypothetical protein
MVAMASVSVDVDVDVSVECSECGADLTVYKETATGSTITVKVDPCGKCLKAARDEAFAEGRAEGYKAGEVHE